MGQLDAGQAAGQTKDPARAIARGEVNIKHDTCARAMPMTILRAKYGTRSTSTPAILHELVRRKQLPASFAAKVENTFVSAMRLRIARHLERGTSDDRLGPLAPTDARAIRRMVPVLRQLRGAVEGPGARMGKPMGPR